MFGSTKSAFCKAVALLFNRKERKEPQRMGHNLLCVPSSLCGKNLFRYDILSFGICFFIVTFLG
ncbi:MAG: hypothetical protein LBT25_07235 [Candidatus Symbiothrix sp.]|jgi:hypothetical protein|nr:hypothetical protein [Candidatus Symbiothrix sp.]